MLGILVQLIISWGLIWFFEKKDLSVLGLRPTALRARDLCLCFMISLLACASGFCLRRVFGMDSWTMNDQISIGLIAKGTWWNLKSVLFEELIFRGVLLYILAQRIGATKAIFISAIAFGIYHWFSFGVFGNIGAMIQIFIYTACAGLLFAWGYTQTGSLWATIGMHLGWNITQNFIFSNGPTGAGIIIPKKTAIDSFPSAEVMMVSFLPLICFFGFNFFLLRQRKRVPTLGMAKA